MDGVSASIGYFGANGSRLQQMERRSNSPTPLGALIGKIVEPVAANKGMGVTTLLTQWPEIVGARIAQICRPAELKWPSVLPKRVQTFVPAQSTLVLRVDGAFALEAQHSAQVIIDRINAHHVDDVALGRAGALKHHPARLRHGTYRATSRR